MNLRERLETNIRITKKTNFHIPRPENTHYQSIANHLQGELLHSKNGHSIRKKSIVPLPYNTGLIRFHRESFHPEGIHCLLKNSGEYKPFHPDGLVFLDTETTGLSGGTGTYVFLVGLGYFTEDSFHIDQYFLLDYGEEYPFLEILNDSIKNYDFLVTYNGKSFDMPLLSTRFQFNRLDPQFDFHWHLDLLHSTRQFWKKRLESCSLSNIEQFILGSSRKEDIPGEYIPQAYFDYLTDGSMGLLPLIFDHNRMDILSLACLTGYMSQCTLSPHCGKLSHGTDYYGVGRLHLMQKHWDTAAIFFEQALKYPLPKTIRYEICRDLAGIYKHQGEWEKALSIWEEMLSDSTGNQHHPLEEIAKYYEHKVRNYKKARLLIEEFIQHSNASTEFRRFISRNQKSIVDSTLTKRLNRLIQKENRFLNSQIQTENQSE